MVNLDKIDLKLVHENMRVTRRTFSTYRHIQYLFFNCSAKYKKTIL